MEEIAQTLYVFDVTDDGFVRDVIERSKLVPVVVDFWATWCQPCRILGPTLEKLAAEFDGKFLLARAETERVPEVASAFGVRSIPAVYGIKGGKVAASFVGAQSESQVRAWIEALMPTRAETLAAEARAIEAEDPAGAEARYREALAESPDDPLLKVALGRVALAQGRPEEARAIIAALELRAFLEPEAEMLKAELTLRGRSDLGGDLVTLRRALETNPGDRSIQLSLAESLAAAGEYDEALALALELVERDRRGTGESARKLMIAIFQLLPPDSSLAKDFRRQLSVAL